MKIRHLHYGILHGDYSGVSAMIMQFARDTYYRLPSSEKIGVSLDDLVQEGRLVVSHNAAKTFKYRSKGQRRTGSREHETNETFDKDAYNTQLTTYIYACLRNYFETRVETALAHKRHADVRVMSQTDVQYGSEQMSLEDFVTKRMSRRDRLEDSIIRRIDAERAFIAAYRKSDPEMRRYLIRWLPQPNETKIKDTPQFRFALKTFRRYLWPLITEEQCRTILNDHECKYNICRRLMDEFMTPLDARRPLMETFADTREHEVISQISPLRSACLSETLPAGFKNERCDAKAPVVARVRSVRTPIYDRRRRQEKVLSANAGVSSVLC